MTEIYCPIWGTLVTETLDEGGVLYVYSPRAGGPFRLMPSGAALLALDSRDDEQKSLPDRQKANLSYSIYKHNLENHLFDELSNEVLQEPRLFLNWMNDHRDRVLELDKDWVETA